MECHVRVFICRRYNSAEVTQKSDLGSGNGSKMALHLVLNLRKVSVTLNLYTYIVIFCTFEYMLKYIYTSNNNNVSEFEGTFDY